MEFCFFLLYSVNLNALNLFLLRAHFQKMGSTEIFLSSVCLPPSARSRSARAGGGGRVPTHISRAAAAEKNSAFFRRAAEPTPPIKFGASRRGAKFF
jgi:hypothetical protein